jgi:hypothetical protein
LLHCLQQFEVAACARALLGRNVLPWRRGLGDLEYVAGRLQA